MIFSIWFIICFDWIQDSRNDFHEEETPLQSEPVFVSSPSNDAKSKDFSSLSSPPLSHTLPDPFHYDVETNPSLSSNSGMDSKNTSHVWHTGSPPHNKSNNSLSLLKSSVHSTKKRSLSIPRISITKTRISLTTTKSAPVSSKMISSECQLLVLALVLSSCENDNSFSRCRKQLSKRVQCIKWRTHFFFITTILLLFNSFCLHFSTVFFERLWKSFFKFAKETI